MMKRILIIVLGLIVTGLIGCQDDGSNENWGAICHSEFDRKYRPDKITNLNEDQKDILRTAFYDACMKYYSDFLICRPELYDRLKCIYLDNTEETLKKEEDKIKACWAGHSQGTPEIRACVDKVYKTCRTEKELLNQCSSEIDPFNTNTSEEERNKLMYYLWELGDDFFLRDELEANAVHKALLQELGMSEEQLYYEGEGYIFKRGE